MPISKEVDYYSDGTVGRYENVINVFVYCVNACPRVVGETLVPTAIVEVITSFSQWGFLSCDIREATIQPAL